MENAEVIRRIWRLLEPVLAEHEVELVEVEYGRHGRGGLLRLYLDKPGGITVGDCADLSRLIGPVLDREDFIEGSYMLEVSSPGFDRPVRKQADFERFAGEKVRIRTHAPVAGRKKFSGILRGLKDGLVVVECDGRPYEIHIENLHKANLDR